MDNNRNNSYAWHLIYGLVILCLLAVFLLLIAPGHINDYAFSHFSFAATLISIVLAVVSIIYSLQAGLNLNANQARIDEIQKNILDRTQELKEIEQKLKTLVDEHKESLQNQADIGSSSETA